MGFQDNAGGIVLDAALTDIGRKRMAQGNFRIDKFALGDDEIDYSLYKPAVGTGSEDFSKLDGAPIMEAFGGQNSNITYGLQNFIREDTVQLQKLTRDDFKEKYELVDYVRIYMNAHTFGMQPHWHVDDGDFTMIY